MSEMKFLAFGIGLFILMGFFFVNITDNFVEEEELENNWVSNYSIDKIASFPVEMIKYPVSAVTLITDFMDGDFWDWITFSIEIQSDTAYVNLSGTGTYNNETLDGKYVYNNDVPDNDTIELEFWHENDTGIFTSNRRHIYAVVNATDVVSSKVTRGVFLGFETGIYNYTSINDTNIEYINNITYEKINPSFDFNNESSGLFVVGENYRVDTEAGDNTGYQTNAGKIFNFFDKIKKDLESAINVFGVIPMEIGLPIFIAFFIAVLYAIIKLLPFT